MALSGARLNTSRFTSILADLAAQFPVPVNLLSAEKTAFSAAQTKVAHAIADHEGTDVVAEVVTNAVVAVASVSGVTTGSSASGPGAGTVS